MKDKHILNKNVYFLYAEIKFNFKTIKIEKKKKI